MQTYNLRSNLHAERPTHYPRPRHQLRYPSAPSMPTALLCVLPQLSSAPTNSNCSNLPRLLPNIMPRMWCHLRFLAHFLLRPLHAKNEHSQLSHLTYSYRLSNRWYTRKPTISSLASSYLHFTHHPACHRTHSHPPLPHTPTPPRHQSSRPARPNIAPHHVIRRLPCPTRAGTHTITPTNPHGILSSSPPAPRSPRPEPSHRRCTHKSSSACCLAACAVQNACARVTLSSSS